MGDNVGDVAGMGSDIFESYCGSMIATIAIAATLSPEVINALAAGDQNKLMFLPLALASVGLVCSLIGIQIVKGSSRKSPDVALRMGTIGASVIFILAALALTHYVDISIKIWLSVLISLEKSRLEYQKMIPEIQALLPTTWAIMSAT